MITALQQVDLAWDGLTSSELAKKLYVSRASIFRMLKKLEEITVN
ncbi:MAG TPA: HTH domain-containing protein [Lactobacillus sp.]|nr:MarR family transcriptional regulator [Ligilactobacillus murinus]HAB49176.1 HTH domain-containing protein [Lactobacillus sp.]HAP22607.1 HTH domain-containing protein [Lactobacillus sp.]